MSIFGLNYGGPSAAIINQDRLVLAGGGGVPDVVAASRTGQWLDFSTTEVVNGETVPTPDSGFWFQQTSARGNRFHALLQQQGMLIFGNIGEASIPPGAFTAAETSIRENSWLGSDTGRTPIIAGNLVVFLQKDGEDVRGMAWNEQQLKYLAPSLLTLSGDVFERARDMTYQPSSGRRGDTVYVMDASDGGNMAVLLLRIQSDTAGHAAPAWSRWRTAGKVIGGAAPLGEAVFVVERNGQTALETLAPVGDRLDCQAVLGAADTLPAWMAGLDSRTLQAYTGEEHDEVGPYPDPFVVTAGGVPVKAALDDDGVPRAAVGNERIDEGRIRIGLGYERILETVQFVKRTQTGTSGRVRPCRIIDAAVDFVLPAEAQGAVTVFGDETAEATRPPEEWLNLDAVVFTVVPYSRRGRPRKLRYQRPKKPSSGRIFNIRYPCRLGWRDRIAVELRSDRHVEIAGIAYRAAG